MAGVKASAARIICGCPGPRDYETVLSEPLRALYYAEANKAAYVFLDNLYRGLGRLPGALDRAYRRLGIRYRLFLRGLGAVGEALRAHGIEYSVIKTFRPFPNVTDDADVLVLGGYEEYEEAVRLLLSLIKPAHVTVGPRSTSMLFPGVNVWIDLYADVAVSHIVYYPRRILAESRIQKRITFMGEEHVFPAPRPEDDAALIIGHSVVKEQLYTLQDHLSLRNYLSSRGFDKALLEKRLRETGLWESWGLFWETHEIVEKRLGEAMEPPPLPYRYPLGRVALAITRLLMKLPEAREGLAVEIARVFTDKSLAEKILYQIHQHLVRKRY